LKDASFRFQPLRFGPARRSSEPWSLVPDSMKPLGPASAAILALATSVSSLSAWKLKIANSQFPILNCFSLLATDNHPPLFAASTE
jgi:hypothetical protein